jgi:hypothetical protein
LDDLQGISGLGVKKLQAYGQQVLDVCRVAQTTPAQAAN